jgi:hypothetical protein
VSEIVDAWHAAGVEEVTITDLEPCPADDERAQWRADIVLVDDRVVVVRPELDREDPLLPALVRSGIREIEHVPSTFVMQPSQGSH